MASIKDRIRPLPGWALCQLVVPRNETDTGLVYAREMEDGKTAEALATVLRLTPLDCEGESVSVGDHIIIREFLKHANPVGHLCGEDRDDRVFLLNVRDILAVVPAGTPVTVGMYQEFCVNE